jgi:hypothetical protein
MFIKRLDLTTHSDKILADLNHLIVNQPQLNTWQTMNQLALTSQPTSVDIWSDGTGSLYDPRISGYRAHEIDFSQWNIDQSYYTRQQVELLATTINQPLGRIRFMRLPPKTGLSVHKDAEVRYHLVLQTNPKAYIAHETIYHRPDSQLPTTSTCYHMPQDNHWYEVDTRQVHWVYNGGSQERIHLVVCGQ